jgi:hypothetical protein
MGSSIRRQRPSYVHFLLEVTFIVAAGIPLVALVGLDQLSLRCHDGSSVQMIAWTNEHRSISKVMEINLTSRATKGEDSESTQTLVIHSRKNESDAPDPGANGPPALSGVRRMTCVSRPKPEPLAEGFRQLDNCEREPSKGRDLTVHRAGNNAVDDFAAVVSQEKLIHLWGRNEGVGHRSGSEALGIRVMPNRFGIAFGRTRF